LLEQAKTLSISVVCGENHYSIVICEITASRNIANPDTKRSAFTRRVSWLYSLVVFENCSLLEQAKSLSIDLLCQIVGAKRLRPQAKYEPLLADLKHNVLWAIVQAANLISLVVTEILIHAIWPMPKITIFQVKTGNISPTLV
jgi:hypothetical protein